VPTRILIIVYIFFRLKYSQNKVNKVYMLRVDLTNMQVITKKISVDSSEKTDFINMTTEIQKIVSNAKIDNGTATIYTKHTTTGICINEDEKGFIRDSKRFLEKKAPQNVCYIHDDMSKRPGLPVDEQINGHSHLKALLLGSSETIPIINGGLMLGKWQSVLFVDLHKFN